MKQVNVAVVGLSGVEKGLFNEESTMMMYLLRLTKNYYRFNR